MAVTSKDSLVSMIQDAIGKEADRLCEEIICTAVKDFETSLRERVATAALKVSDHYDITRYEGEIKITVRHHTFKETQ